jgi:probable F420-dependent oxidoreductase
MVKVAISIDGMHGWFDGAVAPIVEMVQLAERKGVDQVSLGEHMLMTTRTGNYPFGEFSAPMDFPWVEPLVFQSVVAGATSRIRLSTGILISPLRPAVLLAKQVATLDALSRGRVDLGIGVGWHQAEYEACGVSFAGRGDLMAEQVRAMRLLWRQAPASFQGAHVRFDEVWQLPFPAQPRGVPVWFGVPPTPKNVQRIAELGDGWLPLGLTPAQLAEGVQAIKAAFRARGRDPESLAVRTPMLPLREKLKAGRDADTPPDLDETLAQAKAWIEAGVTILELYPSMFCRGPEELGAVLDRLVALKG